MTNARVTYFLITVLLLLGTVFAYAVGADRLRYKVHQFSGVTGPLHRTTLAPVRPTPWVRYGAGETSRLAILLTDPDSSWLGLAHALKPIGLPFRITTEVGEALRHKVVLVYPVISGEILKPVELKMLAAFPRKGGHLIGVNVLGGGAAAIIERSYGNGGSYAFGFDVGDFLFRAQHSRHHDAHRSYVNQFEPSADVITHLIAKIYLRGNPDAATLGSVPEGRKLSVMFSYDIDAGESFEHLLTYARFLKAEGIRGTFYIQTKYVRDFNDVILFDNTAVAHVHELARLGTEIGSHTVSHSNAFTAFPSGFGDES